MVTAVDTSVLLDVLLNDPQQAKTSLEALRHAVSEGSLVICDIAIAELVPVLPLGALPQFLNDFKLQFLPCTQKVSQIAGEMYAQYIRRGGKRGRVVPDFLIAAHAQELADRLLARDRGYYRDYFGKLTLWDPSGQSP